MINRAWGRAGELWRRKHAAVEEDQATIEAQEIIFSFNGTPILNRVSIHIEPRAMVGVIGPNGAGKSTLVRLLSRVLVPLGGEIRLNGVDLKRWRAGELARMLAVVPQDPDLPPAFTAWEIVLMGRAPYLDWTGNESAHDRRIVRKAMSAARIEDLAGRYVGQLSGGERQRVVVARALAQEPAVLLLDEPTSHLDINHQVEVLSLIRRLVREEGLAALAVFHDLNLAAQYCDQLVLLHEGRVVTQGPPSEVLTPELLRKVYGTEVLVISHPANGLPLALPVCTPAS